MTAKQQLADLQRIAKSLLDENCTVNKCDSRIGKKYQIVKPSPLSGEESLTSPYTYEEMIAFFRGYNFAYEKLCVGI